MAGGSKVNTVCMALRNALLPMLSATEFSDSSSAVINPILCTFAKQRPPLLVDALNLIKTYAVVKEPTIHSDSSIMTTSSKVSTTKLLSSIKYLVFLVEGGHLFDAALGVCDFNMCKVIARQCQMDPKSYMALLERLVHLKIQY